MKIAIASEENKGLQSRAAHHFGRCPYYVFINLDKNDNVTSVKTKVNPYYNGHEPGVVPQFIANEKADVIISGGMGPRAIEWFKQLGVTALTASANRVEDVLEMFIKNQIAGAESCHESEHEHEHHH